MPTKTLRAALGVLLVIIAGCSIDRVDQAAEPVVATPAAEPEQLAFAQEDAEQAVEVQAPDDAERSVSAAFTVATDTATVGVHSAPGLRYTRLGTLGPGDNVLSTGREVEVDGVTWMEIGWRDITAWVIASAFAPLIT